MISGFPAVIGSTGPADQLPLLKITAEASSRILVPKTRKCRIIYTHTIYTYTRDFAQQPCSSKIAMGQSPSGLCRWYFKPSLCALQIQFSKASLPTFFGGEKISYIPMNKRHFPICPLLFFNKLKPLLKYIILAFPSMAQCPLPFASRCQAASVFIGWHRITPAHTGMY